MGRLIRLRPTVFGLLACLFFGSGIFGAKAAGPGEYGFQPSPESRMESYEQGRRMIAETMEKATVWVYVEHANGASSGTGFVVADGYVMTNGHVVDHKGVRTIIITNDFLPRTKAKLIKKVNRQGAQDFALLQYIPPKKGASLPVLSFCTDLKRMDRVSAWGYPGVVTGLDTTWQNSSQKAPPVIYTEGAVSGFVTDKLTAVVHTATIAGGNSGGPLINRHGEVVGMNTWVISEKDKGTIVSGALLASDIIEFLGDNQVTASIADPAKRYSPNYASLSPGNQPYYEIPEPEKVRPNRQQPEGGDIRGNITPKPAPPSPPEPIAPIAPRPGHGNKTYDPNALDKKLKDAEKALETLRLAMNGDSSAMMSAALGYMDGAPGYTKDIDRGVNWLKKASNAGHPLAQGLLGMLYLAELDPRNPKLGLETLRKGAENPDTIPQIQAYLAQVLIEGEYLGVPFNPRESANWAQIAAQAGDMGGKAVLGFHYYYGYVLPMDLKKAADLALEAANADNAMGKSLLANIYYDEKRFKREPQKIVDLALEAANAGEGTAQGLLARIYAFEEDYYDPAEAAHWARRAAGLTDPCGQYVLGWLYLNGIAVEKDLEQAWAYLKLADLKMEDLRIETGPPLLQKAEEQMSPAQLKKAQILVNTWRSSWGLEG